MRLRKSYKDGVNSLSAAEPGRTRHRAWPDPPTRAGDNPSTWIHSADSATHGSRPPLGPTNASVHAGADGCWIGLLGQLLDHQDAAQVTRARAAWPLRLGWKKSRVLTWLALNR